jgi:hypothetical protein
MAQFAVDGLISGFGKWRLELFLNRCFSKALV